MKTIDHVNVRIMLASSIWGIALDLGHHVLMEYLSSVMSPPLPQFIAIVLASLSMMLYPLLMSLIMRQRTSLWINPLTYGMLGSMLGLMALMLVRSLLRQLWLDAGLFAFGVWFILSFVASRANTIPALEKERKSHLSSWDELNSLSVLSLVFFQVPSLLGNAR